MPKWPPMNSTPRARGLWAVSALSALVVLGFAADIAGFSIFAYPPAAPVSVRATANFGGTDYIHVSWAPVIGSTSYRIYRSDTGNSNDFEQISATGGTSYSDEVGCGNKVFFYRVTALANGLESVPSLADDGSTALCFVDTTCEDFTVFGPPVAIPDLGAISSTVNGSSSFVVGSVTVRVAVAHTYVSDLVMSLVSPTGTVIPLLNGVATNGNDDLLDVTFDDAAPTAFPPPAVPYAGTFRPAGTLATLAGEDAIGEWRLNVSDDASGDTGLLMAWALAICPEPGSEDGIQSADLNGDKIFNLSELLRCIQLYNIGGYHCADNPGDTEDGYVPGAGLNQSCEPHDTDYAAQDWTIILSELLRAIQFYNSGGYNYCPGDATEDGFCPGL